MTTINLNKEIALQNGVTIGEVLLLLGIHNKVNFDESKMGLIQKGLITADRNDLFQRVGWRLTNKGAEILDSIIMDSGKQQESDDRLSQLAAKLKEIFPKGKKDGTNYYWTEGVSLIARRLKLFFRKYGDTFTDEQIIQASERYVKGFNGNYQYMRLLKYFILKEKIGAGGEVEGDSELISYIENSGQEEDLRNDWTSTLK